MLRGHWPPIKAQISAIDPTCRLAALAALASIALAAPAGAVTQPVVTDFPIPTANSQPLGITSGPDGALWFTESNVNNIGRIDPSTHVVNEFPIPTANSGPTGITSGPDGALWFTEGNVNNIARIDPSTHVVGEFPIPTANTGPPDIAAGPDGALWFTENNGNNIGRIDPSTHAITEFPIPTASSHPQGIAAGPDGALWFVELTGNKIGRIDPSSHVITEFLVPTANSEPFGIASGPDGALWFTEGANKGNNIGRIDPSLATNGTSDGITEFPILTANSEPIGIVSGPDGALWFAEDAGNKIGRIVPSSHVITEFPIPTAGSAPFFIASGPDGALWFTEEGGNKIGRITVPTDTVTVSATGNGAGTVTSAPAGIDCGNGHNSCSANFSQRLTLTAAANAGSTFTGWSGNGCAGVEPCTLALSVSSDFTVSANFVADTMSDIALVAAILPASRSVAVDHTATVFGTIINASPDTAGANCTIQPATSIPASFLFQTTDPNTNALTGTANTPVTIPANQAQSFVLALTPSAPINPTDVAFTFACSNANAVAVLSGINTLLLSAATPQPPDIVALAATTSKDGIVDIPGATGTGFFAVATVNVGSAGTITASADTAAANLPVTISICETNPGTGQCLAAPGASVATMINPGDTLTFAIFVQGSAAVPFSPAANRVFVLFKDASNTVRGETSVAVRTQ